MPATKKPATPHKAVATKQKPITKRSGKRAKKPLNTQLKDWGDKQVIMQSFGIKDSSLKNLRRRNVIGWSTMIGKIYYYIPSFTKLLEENMKGKV